MLGCLYGVLQELAPYSGVALHDGKFLVGKPARLVEDGVGYAYLAHVVQRGRRGDVVQELVVDFFRELLVVKELLRDNLHVLRRALDVPARVAVAAFHQFCHHHDGADLVFHQALFQLGFLGNVVEDEHHADRLPVVVLGVRGCHVERLGFLAGIVGRHHLVRHVGFVDGLVDAVVEGVVLFVLEEARGELLANHLFLGLVENLCGGIVHERDYPVRLVYHEDSVPHVADDVPRYHVIICCV